MPSYVPDTFKLPTAFWAGVRALGLSPAAILSCSDLPATVVAGKADHVTTAQFFALWRAIAELSPDPATGLNLVTRIDARQYPPAVIAAAHARDLRDALNRLARYKQLCAPDEMRMTVERDECVVEFVWPHATEDEPPLLVDAAFAGVVELGRRGTDTAIQPKRLELKRPMEGTGVHAAYFGCPVKFTARRNALIMRASDLDRRFVSYNAELLEMMQRPLGKVLARRQARSSVRETVKGLETPAAW